MSTPLPQRPRVGWRVLSSAGGIKLDHPKMSNAYSGQAYLIKHPAHVVDAFYRLIPEGNNLVSNEEDVKVEEVEKRATIEEEIEMPVPKEPVIEKEDNTKRHLNVVFIGHVGKVEFGRVRENDNLLVMPNKALVKVVAVYCDEDKVRCAGSLENLRVIDYLALKRRLFLRVLCSALLVNSFLNDGSKLYILADRPIHVFSNFFAQLQFLELLDNVIFCTGYKVVLHIHAFLEECEIVELMQQIDPKMPLFFVAYRDTIILYLEDEDETTMKDVSLCCCSSVTNSFSGTLGVQYAQNRSSRNWAK